jgi:hypothetical protein
MFNESHVLQTEVASRAMAENVSLRGVVEDWIGTAVGLKCAVGTARQSFYAGSGN